MDIRPEVIRWLKSMGYEGNTDISFKNIITPATTMIWAQLIQKVRPKQEINLMRKNILINRLSSKNSGNPEVAKWPPIKELEIYSKKRSLEKKLSEIRERIRENDEKLKDVMAQNRIKYVAVERLRKQIEDNERYTFLLRAKMNQLNKEIAVIDDMLQAVRNLTPIEETELTDQTAISETLKGCARKLQIHFEQQNATFSCLSSRKKCVKRSLLQNETAYDSFGLLNDLENTVLDNSTFLSETLDFPPKNENINVHDVVVQLLHSHDRFKIWNCLKRLFEDCEKALLEEVMNDERFEGGKMTINSLSLAKLYGVHVQNELSAKKKQSNIESLKIEIEKALKLFSEGKMRTLNLELRRAALIAENRFLKKEIKKDLRNDEDELRIVKDKGRHLEGQMKEILRDIENFLCRFICANDDLLMMKQKTIELVFKLGQFTQDSEWMRPLSRDLHVKEIEAFRGYCIEQKHVGIPLDADEKVRYEIASLIQNPWCFPESILLKIAEAKSELERLKSLQNHIRAIDTPKYTPRELKEKEDYMDEASRKLDALIRGEGGLITNRLKRLKEAIEIWLEMPFGKYVSKTRTMNRENYEYYERQYDYYYKQL